MKASIRGFANFWWPFIFFGMFPCQARKLRSVDHLDNSLPSNSVEYIWSIATVAKGDTAVLHCSFDAIIQTLPNVNIEWFKGHTQKSRNSLIKKRDKKKRHNYPNQEYFNKLPLTSQKVQPLANKGEWEITGATAIASGKKVLVTDKRFRVFRPHNSALSVLIIRKTKIRDSGIYRCNLARSTTRHRYLILNVTESKIEAQTSVTVMRAKVGSDVALWCNATGYPKPVVYWMRKDKNMTLPDGSLQFWGNGLQIKGVSEMDTGVYECFLDNFVQPIVNYRFTLIVEDSNPWNLEGHKMRFDSKQWYHSESPEPQPVINKTFLFMCEAKGMNKPLPVIRWYRNGDLIRNNKYFYIIEDSPESKNGYSSSTLVIINFMEQFKGNYTCVAYTTYRMKKLAFSLSAPILRSDDRHDYYNKDNSFNYDDYEEEEEEEDEVEKKLYHHNQ